MLLIYRFLINIILLISPLIILFRLLKKKEDPIRFKEKFCFFSKKRSKGNLVWFHGASVGEILSIIPLIEKLEKNKKIKQILITSNTLSSSKIISNLKLKKTIHQFFPIDTNYHTLKFINYWKPTIAIFVDSEIWPNMLINIKRKSISLALLNARITKKSFKKWKTLISLGKTLFKKFDICLPANKESQRYLHELGAKKIKYIGNLKFSQTEKNENLINESTMKFFKNRKIWCAASTHKTEEKLCILAHKKLKLKYNNLLTIIIPRHVNRSDDIISEIKSLDLNVHAHESSKVINKNTDIYLVNSYGKTKSFFKICKIVFLGGSLIKHGGQNPIEAARFGCKILHGKNISNFREIYELLDKNKVSSKINNSNQMAKKIEEIFREKNKPQIIETKIRKLGNKVLNSTLKEVNFLLKK